MKRGIPQYLAFLFFFLSARLLQPGGGHQTG